MKMNQLERKFNKPETGLRIKLLTIYQPGPRLYPTSHFMTAYLRGRGRVWGAALHTV